MDLLLFCTAFIIQFVGHRMGDYLFQTDWQAQNKIINNYARFAHCLVYSLTIGLLLFPFFGFTVSVSAFFLTLTEHYFIDNRKPIIWWKTFLETKIAKQKDFDINQMPFFVLIEIDQTVHYIRIFLISIMIGYGLL